MRRRGGWCMPLATLGRGGRGQLCHNGAVQAQAPHSAEDCTA